MTGPHFREGLSHRRNINIFCFCYKIYNDFTITFSRSRRCSSTKLTSLFTIRQKNSFSYVTMPTLLCSHLFPNLNTPLHNRSTVHFSCFSYKKFLCSWMERGSKMRTFLLSCERTGKKWIDSMIKFKNVVAVNKF